MAACVALRVAAQELSKDVEKQGIISILSPTAGASPPLRRTLSADMSSKRWLAEFGVKKSPSSSPDEFPSPLPNPEENAAPNDQLDQKEDAKPAQSDIWESIMSQQEEEEEEICSLPAAPYVHPLVKRSASSLSEKSLEICTESLGSESGSDGFSSYPPSESNSDAEDYVGRKKEEVVRVSKCEKSPPRCFPPPLPSLSHQTISRRRENDRLVLDAVSVPSQNFFRADRRDGRLVLSFVNAPCDEDSIEERSHDGEAMVEEEKSDEEENGEAVEKEMDSGGEEEEEEEEESESVEMGVVAENPLKPSPGTTGGGGGLINVHRSAIPMKKLINLSNTNAATWHSKFDQVVFDFEKDETALTTAPPLGKSLPPRPRMARLITAAPPMAAASFNAYERHWRNKAASGKRMGTENATGIGSLAQSLPPMKDEQNHNKLIITNNKPQLLLLRGNRAEYFAPLLRGGCKEDPTTNRSILIWEPCGIATSS